MSTAALRQMTALRQMGARPRVPMMGFVLPSDILAYRVAWNQYVTDTCRAANECAAAYLAVAAQQPDANTKNILTGIGNETQRLSDIVLQEWNLFQDKATADPAYIVLQGAFILQSFQRTVLNAGQLRNSMTTGTLTCALNYHDTNGNVVACVPGVDPNIQAQIIARIEGLGILGSGVLQILVEGAANTLIAAGDAAKQIAKVSLQTTSWLLSPWTWGIVGTVLIGTTVFVVYNSEKVAKLVTAARPI
jgi:hypothetical protein